MSGSGRFSDIKNPAKPLIAGLLILMSVCFAGCSSRPDAAAFVKSVLDSRYLGVSGTETDGGASEPAEDAFFSREAVLSSEADRFRVFFDINENHIPQSLNKEITKTLESVLSAARYEVGAASRSENIYIVSVTVYPLDIMRNTVAGDIGGFIETWQRQSDAGYPGGMSGESFETLWASGIVGLVNARTDDIGTLEPETVSVRVSRDSSGGGVRLIPNENDLDLITRLILPY